MARLAEINRILEVQSDGIDLVLGYRLEIGVGYGLACPGPGMVVWPIAAALVERVYDIVNR